MAANSYSISSMKSTSSRRKIPKSFTEEDHQVKSPPHSITRTSGRFRSQKRRSPPHIINNSVTSRDKRDYSRELHASFTSEHGLSIEEITCDEIDDMLPKTDYTYARTESYSPKFSGERYISPNMSRRRLRSSQPVFLSDDEEEFSRYESDHIAVSDNRVYSHHSQTTTTESEVESSAAESRRFGIARVQNVMTSTPVIPHNQHQISTNDHYYEGILLRSGSHLKGTQRYYRDHRSSMSNSHALHSEEAVHSNAVSNSAYRSDVDVARQHQRSGRNTIITETTTTTTTTSTLHPNARKDQNKMNAFTVDDHSETKLRLDESQTEKDRNKQEYKLKHLYGLDFEEEISDVDDMAGWDITAAKHNHHSQKEFDLSSYFITFITTVITTITTTVASTFSADGSTSFVKPLSMAASKLVVGPGSWLMTPWRCLVAAGSWFVAAGKWFMTSGRWLMGSDSWLMTQCRGLMASGGWMAASRWLMALGSWLMAPGRRLLESTGAGARWLITRSATLLLWDIDVKQRRRRGCCCCFLPLLFLLPLLLLGGYYTRALRQSVGAYLSDTSQVLSWSNLWFTHSSGQRVPFSADIPPASTPTSIPFQTAHKEAAHQMKMTQIYEFIQQMNAASAASSKESGHPGLTKEEVEAVVRGLLATSVLEISTLLQGQVDAMKILLQGDISSLQQKVTGLEAEIHATVSAHKVLTDKLNQASSSFEGSHKGLLPSASCLTGDHEQAKLCPCFEALRKKIEAKEEGFFWLQKNFADQKVNWLAASKALENKLLNLTQDMNNLSAQYAFLDTRLANCCRNSSDLDGIIRAHVFSVLSQMSTDEGSPLASLMVQLNQNYVDKAEMDARLSAITLEVMKNINGTFAESEWKSHVYAAADLQEPVSASINESAVKIIVEKALNQFSADRVGMADFALESAGGSIISVRCSETYYKKTALVSVFGIPLWYTSNSPRTVIQPDVHPGECWAFKGQKGCIVLQLSHPIEPSGFTLEHIPRSLTPTGDISSAPEDFAVFGLVSETDPQGIKLGNYTYADNGIPIQFFPVQSANRDIFQIVELRILSNHGNIDYTCVYRFRVHGKP